MPQRLRTSLAEFFDLSPDWPLAPVKLLAGFLVGVWMSIPAAVQCVIVLASIDYATGLLSALKRRDLCGRTGREGLMRKAAMLLLICGVGYTAKSYGLPALSITGLSMAFSINELISITENAAEVGVRIPGGLLTFLRQAKGITGRGQSAQRVKEELE